jgi:hypothetical protein
MASQRRTVIGRAVGALQRTRQAIASTNGGPDAGAITRAADTPAELQEELLRFEGRFSARMAEGFQALIEGTSSSEVRLRAMNDELEYVSAALDIAVGPSPGLGLLDMVTLVALGRDAMATYWRANAAPELARPIEAAFDASLEDVRAVARTVLTPDLEKELFGIIREWQLEHPGERHVVVVRLSEYTSPAFGASTSLGQRTFGLLTLVGGLVRSADNALLLGRRTLFAAQRLPFLLRVHVQIATGEALLDARRAFRDTTRQSLPEVQRTAAGAGKDVMVDVRRTIVDAEELAKHLADDILRKMVVYGGALACVAAVAWLLARLAYSALAAH